MEFAKIIENLQSIQDNLIGIILPVVITAFVSILTVLVNAAVQIILQNSKFNDEQYKIMQEFYPNMKICLLKAQLSAQRVEENLLVDNITEAIEKYLEYKDNEKKYRKEHADEVQCIDSFISSMEDYSKCMIELYKYLSKCKIPKIPMMHPILKNRVSKMLINVQYYTELWNEYQNKSIVKNTFKHEVKEFKSDSKTLRAYCGLLDKWFAKLV
jgi:hypothetical protein